MRHRYDQRDDRLPLPLHDAPGHARRADDSADRRRETSFANANTIILMGRTRHDGRFGRALAIPKHRGSACGDEILPYRITEQGLVFD